jgi:hypothetical protein
MNPVFDKLPIRLSYNFNDDEIPVSNIEYEQHGNDQTQNDVQLNNTDNIVNNNVEDEVFEVEKIVRKKYTNGKWL